MFWYSNILLKYESNGKIAQLYPITEYKIHFKRKGHRSVGVLVVLTLKDEDDKKEEKFKPSSVNDSKFNWFQTKICMCKKLDCQQSCEICDML